MFPGSFNWETSVIAFVAADVTKLWPTFSGHPVDIPSTLRETAAAMAKTLIEVTKDATELLAPERLKFARILLDLSDANPEPAEEVQAAWEAEIQRRLGELRAGTVRGMPVQDVKRKIEARFHS